MAPMPSYQDRPHLITTVGRGQDMLRAAWEAARRQPALTFGIPALMAVLAVGAVLMVTRRYKADVSFVPEASSSIDLPSSVLGIVSELNLGRKSSESPQFYTTLLGTRPVQDHLLRLAPVAVCQDGETGSTLLERFKAGGRSTADSLYRGRQKLAKRLASDVDLRTGIVSLSIEAACPALATELADSVVAILNEFNIQTRQSTAKARRIFIEGQAADADSSLRQAEDALESFLLRNRRFDTPDLQFQQARLQRRVDYWQDVATGLRRQYESARIEEVNSTPVLTVIQPASLPIRASWPKRRLIVIFAVFLGALLGGTLAIGRTLAGPLPPDASPRLRAFHQWARGDAAT